MTQMHLLTSTQPGAINAGFAKQLKESDKVSRQPWAQLSPTTNHTRPTHVWQVLLQLSGLAEISESALEGRKRRNQIHVWSISLVSAQQFWQAFPHECLLQVHLSQWGCSFVCNHGNLKHIMLILAGSLEIVYVWIWGGV